MAVAMLVAFSVAGHSGHGPTGRVVVTTHAVRLGSTIGAADVAVEAVSLPGEVAAQTFSSVDQVVGAVALAPLAAGAIVEPSAVAVGRPRSSSAELSFPVDRNRALDGALQVGEPLDLLATYGTGDTARTVVVARAVRLVDLDDDTHGGLESTGKVVVTIQLRDPTTLLAVTHATEAAAVTLVRSRGPLPPGPDSYTPSTDPISSAPPGSSGSG